MNDRGALFALEEDWIIGCSVGEAGAAVDWFDCENLS